MSDPLVDTALRIGCTDEWGGLDGGRALRGRYASLNARDPKPERRLSLSEMVALRDQLAAIVEELDERMREDA